MADPTVASLLDDKIKDVGLIAARTQDELTKHVQECAKMQKWVLGVAALTLGWVVAHSPEGAKVAIKLIELF